MGPGVHLIENLPHLGPNVRLVFREYGSDLFGAEADPGYYLDVGGILKRLHKAEEMSSKGEAKARKALARLVKKTNPKRRRSLRQASRTRAAVVSNPGWKEHQRKSKKHSTDARKFPHGPQRSYHVKMALHHALMYEATKPLSKFLPGMTEAGLKARGYRAFMKQEAAKEKKAAEAKLKKNPKKRKNPTKQWTTGSEVQTLIFPKAQGFTRAQAKSWAKRNGFKYGKVDETGTSFRLRQREPGSFSTMRTISMGDSGVKAVVGPLKRGKKKGKRKNPTGRKQKTGSVLTNSKKGAKYKVWAKTSRLGTATGAYLASLPGEGGASHGWTRSASKARLLTESQLKKVQNAALRLGWSEFKAIRVNPRALK